MDTNKILKDNGYGNHTDFVNIARDVTHRYWVSEQEILDYVNAKYGAANIKIEHARAPQEGQCR